jgi:hypothetical protein
MTPPAGPWQVSQRSLVAKVVPSTGAAGGRAGWPPAGTLVASSSRGEMPHAATRQTAQASREVMVRLWGDAGAAPSAPAVA